MAYLSTSYEEILFQRKNKFDIYIFIIKKIEKKLSGKNPAKMHTTGTCNMYLVNLKVVVTLTRVQFATMKVFARSQCLKKI